MAILTRDSVGSYDDRKRKCVTFEWIILDIEQMYIRLSNKHIHWKVLKVIFRKLEKLYEMKLLVQFLYQDYFHM